MFRLLVDSADTEMVASMLWTRQGMLMVRSNLFAITCNCFPCHIARLSLWRGAQNLACRDSDGSVSVRSLRSVQKNGHKIGRLG
jgi:hypothetical protein